MALGHPSDGGPPMTERRYPSSADRPGGASGQPARPPRADAGSTVPDSASPSSAGEAAAGHGDGAAGVRGAAQTGAGPAAEPVGADTAEPAASELDRLRGEVTALRARNEELERARRHRPVFSVARGSTGRRILSTVLVVLAVILAPVSVLSVWAKGTLTDTGQYVATVAPLAQNPDVQAAVTARLTAAVTDAVDVPALVQRVLPSGQSELAGPLTSVVDRFIGGAVSGVVHSPRFAEAWTAANRAAHAQLMGALQGTSTGGLSVKNGEVTLNLGQLVDQVKRQLSAQGLTAVDRIPTDRIGGTFTLFQSTAVTKVQWGFRALQVMGTWLPFVALAVLLLGVWLARDRRRALIGAGAGVVVVMLLFGLGTALGRSYYVNHLPASVSRPAVTAAADVMLRFLRQSFWAMVVLGVLVAAAAVVAGPSAVARGTRNLCTTGMGRLGDRAERARVLPTPVRTFVAPYRRWWEVGVVVAGVVVLFFWRGRTVAVEVWTAVIVVVGLLLVELVGRRTPGAAVVPGGDVAEAAPPPTTEIGGDGSSGASAA